MLLVASVMKKDQMLRKLRMFVEAVAELGRGIKFDQLADVLEEADCVPCGSGV